MSASGVMGWGGAQGARVSVTPERRAGPGRRGDRGPRAATRRRSPTRATVAAGGPRHANSFKIACQCSGSYSSRALTSGSSA